MLQCNANEESAVGFYRAKGFKQNSAVDGENGNNNCWDLLPEALQSCLQKGNKYMFIAAESYPMDLMTLHPSEDLKLQTVREVDKDFALRFPSSTLTCGGLDDYICEGKYLKAYIGEEPYLFSNDEETRKKLVKDEAEVVPPGRIRGIPKHVFQQQSKESFITGDHIQLLISLMKRNAKQDSGVAFGVHIVPLDISVHCRYCVESIEKMKVAEKKKDKIALASHQERYRGSARLVKLYLNKNLDEIVDYSPFLCYIENQEAYHWTMNIAVNAFQSRRSSTVRKGYFAYDSLGDTRGINDLNPQLGFRFFLNLVQSYHDFVSSHSRLGGEPPTGPMEIVIPFGDHRVVHGTEEFPQLILEDPDFLSQQDRYNCGIAVMMMLLEVCTKWSNEATVMFRSVPQSRYLKLIEGIPTLEDRPNIDVVCTSQARVNETVNTLDSKGKESCDVLASFRLEFFQLLEKLAHEYERSLPVQDPKAPPSPDSSLENADVEIVLQKKGGERVVNLGTTEPEVIQESSGATDELPQPAASPQEPVTVTQQTATTSSTGVQTLSQDLDESTDSDDTGGTDGVEVVRVLEAGDAGAAELEKTAEEAKSETNEHEAEVLIHLSQGPRLSNATFTAEAWDEVLEANPINKETIPSFLLRPPEPQWSKAMHDATVRAWTDFGSLKDGTPGEEGISKFCSLLPSCVGMYQGFHEDRSTHFNGTTCHCPLSEEFAPTWKKFLPDIELPVCRKQLPMTANSLVQHCQFCQDKPTEAYHKIVHLYLEALYRHPPRHEEQNKDWHAHPAFFRFLSRSFNLAMANYKPSNPLVSRYGLAEESDNDESKEEEATDSATSGPKALDDGGVLKDTKGMSVPVACLSMYFCHNVLKNFWQGLWGIQARRMACLWMA